jgi:hypothetical protein
MSNQTVIDNAFKDFEKNILDTTEQELKRYCWQILDAAIKAREHFPGAHDFTGNLLNSIVVCLYKRRNPVIAYFSSSLVPEAIRPKMRILRSSEKRYGFNPDYSGDYSIYKPTVPTNGGWGRDDAENFFETFVPDGNNLFDIVVAYTVEYADWVNQQRGTTGILETEKYARRAGMKLLQLKTA